MRHSSLTALAFVCAVACGAGPTTGGSGRPPPRRIEPEESTVTIRNNCPDPVTLGIGREAPAADAETFEVSGSGVEQTKLPKRERVWLRYREEWSQRRSATADQDGWVIEVLASCDGVTSRAGPL